MSIEDEWIEIAAQRLKEIREGNASTTPHEKVMRMVDADLDEIDRQRRGGKLVRLDEYGISKEEAADLRHRLQCFAEDWERPEMDVYDID